MKIQKIKPAAILAVSLLLMLASALYLYRNSSGSSVRIPDAEAMTGELQQMEKQLNVYTDSLVSDYRTLGNRTFFTRVLPDWCKRLNEHHFVVLIREDGIPKVWTDNAFLEPSLAHTGDSVFETGYMNNAWVLSKKRVDGNLEVSSFIVIGRDYSISNPYFESDFHPDLQIPSGYRISNVPDPAGFSVKNSEGDFLFCLMPSESDEKMSKPPLYFFSLFFFYTGMALLLVYFFRVFLRLDYRYKTWFFVLLIIAFALFRILQTLFRFPAFLYETDLFSPVYYASSFALPSLGDLLLNLILLFFLVLLFGRKSFLTRNDNVLRIYISFFLFFIMACLSGWVMRSLVFHSGINVNLINIIESDPYSLLILFINALLTGILLIVLDKLFRLFVRQPLPGIWFLLSLFFLFAIVIAIQYFLTGIPPDWIFISFVTLLITFFYIIYGVKMRPLFTNVLILMILSSLFLCFHFGYNYREKDLQMRKTIVVGLSNEHDVVSEMQMEDLSNRIANDYIIRDLSQKPYENQEDIFTYIKTNYIYGYWTRYDLKTTLCSPYDNLRIQQTGKIHSCFQYFSDMITGEGMQIEGSNFYYIDHGNGRINYIGIFDYPRSSDSLTNQLYIELESKLQMHVLGYPDILIDKKIKRSRLLDEYSYAIYRNGSLVSASGKYQYSFSARQYKRNKSEFSILPLGSDESLVYRPSDDTLIVLTGKRITAYHYLTLFAYVFTLFSLALALFYLISFVRKPAAFAFTVKQRIRTALITVFLLSLVMMGVVATYYIIDKYKYKQLEVLTEKMQSILIELNHKLGSQPALPEADRETVTNLLIKFSNVFYTDIHLYDRNGQLYATSRNDVFSKGLTGTLMNPDAFVAMSHEQKTEFVHQETIGNLSYYSGYIPFFNQQGKLLAYLNLPYFTRQADLTREISDFIVALFNILLILFIIGVWLTWWLSDNLTRPLAMIQQKMQNVRLGKPNEPIHYHRMDEIGALVSEYNRMLDELDQSARMLAESERESAWREMAKQIAHEIKNPLTPMKISIQYLQKAYHEQMPGWEGMIDKVTKTLVEQIDSLSAIASEFSAFARMPYPVNEQVNMAEMGKSLLTLYEHIDNVDFSLVLNNEDELWARGDKEHLLRMFNNLIKNSIQAIPPDRKGVIRIELTGYPQEVMIRISDNGSGIAPEIQDRLYVPSFTTKSSGMGLGLAIVKRIVESMHGSIRFVTAENQGTTFFIELPK